MLNALFSEITRQFNEINWVALTIQGVYTTIIFIIVVYFLEKHIIKTLETTKNVIREQEKMMDEPKRLISKPFKVILKNGKRRKKYHYPLR